MFGISFSLSRAPDKGPPLVGGEGGDLSEAIILHNLLGLFN
jgi:hypothetical protein